MRVVLDTNVFISAALFKGKVSRLLNLWKTKKFTFLLSGEILKEYARVLSYPKFHLSEQEIKFILENELLPFIETVPVKEKSLGLLKDTEDEKFLNCAHQGNADYLVTGDAELLRIGKYKEIQIVDPGTFLSEIL